MISKYKIPTHKVPELHVHVISKSLNFNYVCFDRVDLLPYCRTLKINSYGHSECLWPTLTGLGTHFTNEITSYRKIYAQSVVILSSSYVFSTGIKPSLLQSFVWPTALPLCSSLWCAVTKYRPLRCQYMSKYFSQYWHTSVFYLHLLMYSWNNF